MSYGKDDASGLLRHYLRMASEGRLSPWENDYDVEIEALVDGLVDPLNQRIDELTVILGGLLEQLERYLRMQNEAAAGMPSERDDRWASPDPHEVRDYYEAHTPPITNPHTGETTPGVGAHTGWVVFPEHGAAFRLVAGRLRMAPLLVTPLQGSFPKGSVGGDGMNLFDLRDEVEVDFDRLDEGEVERMRKVEIAMFQTYLRERGVEARVDEARGER